MTNDVRPSIGRLEPEEKIQWGVVLAIELTCSLFFRLCVQYQHGRRHGYTNGLNCNSHGGA